jgi:hypothetical protein
MKAFDELLGGEKDIAIDRCSRIVLDLLYLRIIVLEDKIINRKLLSAIDECDHYIDFVRHPKILESDVQCCIKDLAEAMAMDGKY